MTKKLLLLCNLILISVFQVIAQNDNPLTVASGNVQLHFSLTANGIPNYRVSYKDKTIISPSAMGFVCKNFHLKMGLKSFRSRKSRYHKVGKLFGDKKKTSSTNTSNL